MRERPMFALAWVCVLSVLFQFYRKPILLICAVLLILYVMDWKRKDKKKSIAGGIVLLAMFFLFFHHSAQFTARRELCREKIENESVLTVLGEVERIENGNGYYRYYLTNCRFYDGDSFCPCNHMLVYGKESAVRIGEVVELSGEARFWEKARNYGNFDAEDYYYSLNIDFAIYEKKIISRQGKPDRVREWIDDWKEKFAEDIQNHLSEENAGVLKAMVLGDKSDLDRDVKSLYEKSGLAHILAISGLHVTLLGLGLFRLLKRLYVPMGFNMGITISFLLAYGCMTGNGISTKRAMGMLFVLLGGRLLKLPEDTLNSLGLVTLFLLWENPFLIQNTGFLFSVSAILGIGVTAKSLVKYIDEVFQPKTKTAFQRKRLKALQNLITCFGIYITTLPLVLHTSFELPTYGVFINLILLPLLPFVIGGGISALFFSQFSLGIMQGPGSLLWRAVDGLLSFMGKICGWIGKFPFSTISCGKPSEGRTVAYLLLLLIFILLVAGFTKWGNRKFYLLGGVLVLLFACAVFPRKQEKALYVLDVGQGCGIYAESEEGGRFFFDGGSTDVRKVGSYRILPFLKAMGIPKIDYWFLSHLDEDHCNGFVEMVEAGYEVEYLFLPSYVIQDDAYEMVKELADRKEIKVRYVKGGDTLLLKGFQISCLWPQGKNTGRNEGSLVLRMCDSEDFSVLLTGDISAKEEAQILEESGLPPTRLLIAAHHGANGSNSSNFLKQGKFEAAVISCGRENTYGHPGTEAVERMKEAGLNIYYTMESGQITFQFQ